jgi:hypothetical protein
MANISSECIEICVLVLDLFKLLLLSQVTDIHHVAFAVIEEQTLVSEIELSFVTVFSTLLFEHL